MSAEFPALLSYPIIPNVLIFVGTVVIIQNFLDTEVRENDQQNNERNNFDLVEPFTGG